MANIVQEPALNNSAYVPNVWTLDNLGSADRFILQVVIDGNAVVTYKQPANPAGVAHFDISKVLQAYMSPEFVEQTQKVTDTEGAHLTYRVKYGTETGNTESQLVEYPQDKFVINAYDRWNVLNSDLSAFIPEPGAITCPNSNINARYASPYSFLTNYPNAQYTVRSDEYKTLSFYNRIANFADGTNWGPNAAPFFAVFTSSADEEYVYTISQANGSTVRVDCNDMSASFTDDNIIATIGVGPENIDGFFTLPYNSYTVEIYSYNNCMDTLIADCNDMGEILLDGYLGDVIYSAEFVIEDACSPFEPITVSFMNQYGVKDYITMDRRNQKTVTTSRNNYYRDNGTYGASTFSIDQHGRGETTFSSEATTQMTLQTNWMDDATSKWLQELYKSPSIMIYYDGNWEPCTIVSNSYEEKTYARNRMFQHELAVQFANTQNMQRG